MTKNHWKDILEELKTMFTTNKFQTGILYTPKRFPVDERVELRVESIRPNEYYLKLEDGSLITYDNVKDIRPSEMRLRFFVKLNVFKIKYKF